MKKYIFTVVALFLGVCQMSAQTIVFEPVVEVPLDGKAQVAVKYETGGLRITTYSLNFDLSEAEGLSLTQKDGGVDFVTDSKNSAFNVSATATGIGATAKNTSVSLDGTTGTLGTVTFEATAPLKVNDEVTVKVNKLSLVEYTDDERLVTIELPETSFTVKIVENLVTLDENSTTAPEAAENVNVLVKRSVKAGNWGTICLPFAMTEDQVKAAFGDGAKLADFDGTELIKDDEGLISEIKVKFVTATSVAANHPYLLKSENDITYEDGFKVEGVNVKATKEPQVGKDLVYDENEDEDVPNSFFYGTYVPIVLDKATYLFLSGNKFYYSNRETKMKGFRGYFKLQKVLAAKYKDLSTGAHIGIVIDDEATSIEGFTTSHVVEGVYDLSGRKIQLENGDLNKLQKGVYIIDGKKVTIK